MGTIADYFIIPEVKTTKDYQLNKEDIRYEYNVIKRKNIYLLIDRDEIHNDFFWILYDLSDAIKNRYRENLIYMIVERDEDDNIDIIVGNTVEPYFKNFHSKYKIQLDNKSSIKKINDLIDIAMQTLNIDKIVVYNINLDESDIYDIVKYGNIEINSGNQLKRLLYKIPAVEPIRSKIRPYILVIALLVGLYFAADYAVEEYNKKIAMKMDSIKREWISKLDSQEYVINNLDKEISKHIDIEKMADKDVYVKGD